MSELRALYQDLILDHGRRPRNFGGDPAANRHAEGHNPLCGDELALHLRLADGVIADAHFEGQGCAISTAAASLMTEAIKGKTEAQARQLLASYLELVAGAAREASAAAALGKLAALGGVRAYPARVKCATLAWHTLDAALAGQDTATTE